MPSARKRAPWNAKLYSGGAICGVILVAMVGPGLFTGHTPFAQNMMERLRPPIWLSGALHGHVLGTDHLGRDILARIVYGTRISGSIAVLAVVCAGTVGTALGLIGGYLGGMVDLAVGAATDFMLSFPFMLTALLMVAVMGPSLINLVVVLAIASWPTYARIARTETVALRERDFVSAATAMGLEPLGIMRRHILPNMMNSLIVIASLEVARLMISEAFLSFLGVGVPPPLPAWGSMIADGRSYLLQQWWLATFPGLAIFISAVGINLLGDALRDIWDPRLRSV
jgi:peptide/nickel transport system permease protein